MTSKDLQFVIACGVMSAALFAFLLGFEIPVPLWLAAIPTLLIGASVFVIRVIVGVVGEDQTRLDEILDIVEDKAIQLEDILAEEKEAMKQIDAARADLAAAKARITN